MALGPKGLSSAASGIQAQYNAQGIQFLISEALYQLYGPQNAYRFAPHEQPVLRDQAEPTALLDVQ